jgi:hypothetical protein
MYERRVGVAARTATRNTRKKTAARKPPAKTTPPPRRSDPAAPVPPSPEVRQEADARLADMRDRAADLMDRAADVLDGARQAAADEAAALIRAAEEQAHTIRQAAAADARQVLAEVADEAGERLRRAEGDADSARSAADQEAQQILDTARADAVRAAEEITRTAGEQARTLLTETEEQAVKLADLRRASAEAAYRTALADAAKILGEAQEQASEVKAAHAAVEAETDLVRRRSRLELDEELAERRSEIEAELAERREKARRQAEDDAEAIRARAEREAGQLGERAAAEALVLRKDAEAKARAAVADIRREAELQLKAAQDTRMAVGQELQGAREKHQLAEERAASLKRGRTRGEAIKQMSIWVALTAVIVLTASGEWQFARLVGLGDTPVGDAGWALPLGLDVYAITAFRAKKDVPFALGLMAATNVTYHVADMTGAGMHVVGGKAHPSVALIVVAVIVVVAIVWRIHRLLENGHDDGEPGGGIPPAQPGNRVDDDAVEAAVTGTGSGPATSGTGTGNPGSTGTGNPTGKTPSVSGGNRTGNGGRPRSGKGGRPGGGKRPEGRPTAEQRAAVRARAAEILASGESPSPTALAAEFGGLDPEWVRNQIRAVR